MAIPKWQTPSGLLDTIQERVEYEKQLVATDTDGDTVRYSLLVGSLPSGLNLTSAGKIIGFPNEVGFRTEKTFVVRATAGSDVVDRTFTLFVEGSDAPTWVTAAGVLGVIYDGTYVDIQLEANDTDTQDSTSLTYEIIAGGLPDGVSLSSQGKITGVVAPIPLEAYDSSQLGLDGVAFDTSAWDLVIRSGSIDRLYQFTVRVSDGITYADRSFSLDVRGLGKYKADTTAITTDEAELTADVSDIRGLYFTQEGVIATLTSGNYQIVKINVIDPDAALGLDGDTSISYSKIAGDFPPGMSINSGTGTISGIVATANNTFTDYTFTLQATKSSPIFGTEFTTKQLTIRITGLAYQTVTWNQNIEELVL